MAEQTRPEHPGATARREDIRVFMHACLSLTHGHLGHALDALEMKDEALLAYSMRAGAASFRAALDTFNDMKGRAAA